MLTKRIKLTQGKYALVDARDYESLNKLRWHTRKHGRNYYAVRKNGKKKEIFMHWLVLGKRENKVTDHINGDGLDNRRKNLRFCTNQQNAWNASVSINNKSGFRGVSYFKRDKTWRAVIRVKRKLTWLGDFKKKVEAALAYNSAALKFFGEYARLNKT